jgi:hypothetical protein
MNLKSRVAKLERILAAPAATLTAKLWTDPAAIFHHAGMKPDPWQERVLRSQADKIMILDGDGRPRTLSARPRSRQTSWRLSTCRW